jgi:hypothetical protein
MPKLQTPGLLGFVASGEPETPHSICPTEISNGSPSQPLRRGTVRAHRKSALENPRCSTDLMASASQNHRPGITLSTHRRSSVSSASRGRSTSNHHRPKADSVPHPSPDLTTPASWDYRIGIGQETTSPQIGPPTLPRERRRTSRWSPVDAGYSLLMRLQLRASSPPKPQSLGSNKTQKMLRNSKYAC